jgi:hypothetical protein
MRLRGASRDRPAVSDLLGRTDTTLYVRRTYVTIPRIVIRRHAFPIAVLTLLVVLFLPASARAQSTIRWVDSEQVGDGPGDVISLDRMGSAHTRSMGMSSLWMRQCKPRGCLRASSRLASAGVAGVAGSCSRPSTRAGGCARWSTPGTSADAVVSFGSRSARDRRLRCRERHHPGTTEVVSLNELTASSRDEATTRRPRRCLSQS